MNIVDAILESYPKSKKALFEEIGLETEEELGIKIPEI
jgi:26S proteasome regulatory subunit (ATPase 3-interacting protein)